MKLIKMGRFVINMDKISAFVKVKDRPELKFWHDAEIPYVWGFKKEETAEKVFDEILNFIKESFDENFKICNISFKDFTDVE